MKAIWSNNSDSSLCDDEEHVVNICFMAIERENEVISSNDEFDLFYNELHDAFETLYDEYKKLGSKVCSRHITEDDSLFSSITKINGGKVTFGDNSKEKLLELTILEIFVSPLMTADWPSCNVAVQGKELKPMKGLFHGGVCRWVPFEHTVPKTFWSPTNTHIPPFLLSSKPRAIPSSIHSLLSNTTSPCSLLLQLGTQQCSVSLQTSDDAVAAFLSFPCLS
ncbi:hypothetical protein NC651_021704 [Populus alba x Populus x berolinensis]|nr:hypothetical protein NC651_021704 [Populus alba x Populus x berolinensis]